MEKLWMDMDNVLSFVLSSAAQYDPFKCYSREQTQKKALRVYSPKHMLSFSRDPISHASILNVSH